MVEAIKHSDDRAKDKKRAKAIRVAEETVFSFMLRICNLLLSVNTRNQKRLDKFKKKVDQSLMLRR